MGLAARLVSLVSLFALELIVISTWLDTAALDGKGGLTGAVGDLGPYVLQSLVVFATVLLALGYSKAKPTLVRVSESIADVRPEWGLLAVHCAAMGAFAFLSSLLFAPSSAAGSPVAGGNSLAGAWLAAGICGIAAGAFFFIPLKTCRELLRSAGSAWVYALAAAAISPVLVVASKRLWKPATALTFELVKFLLGHFVSGVIAEPAARTIGTEKFSVEIASSCSGLEGVGLMLIFSVLWLWFFRGDYKFPQALLLVPVGACVIFLLNAVRIAALILIGDAGATAVALGGFHSQAGWIAFNGVALGLASIAHRMPWLSAEARSVGRSMEPAAAADRAGSLPDAYLVPFLAILAATMISRATSGNFEWMYPLRFAAAAGALFSFRRAYAGIDWKFGWAAPAVGSLVFILWIGLDRISGTHADNAMPMALAASPAALRILWLVFRTLAAVITVPVAEELAFRGFLLRRLISADFESVSFQRWTLLSVLGSSLAFGLLHGDRWIAGTIAGFLYAAAQKWRGRIVDAMVAHGVTNGLIAIWVLWGGNWALW
ncbi:MAG TPA: exosortase E/protease, VPEID-CTERM system [Bryobacteraceae bacterium]|jgi:exosortase E/protease (VPEID-CTERM system)